MYDVLRNGGGGGLGSKVIAYVDGKVVCPYSWAKIVESFKSAEEMYLSIVKGQDAALLELEGALVDNELVLIAKDLNLNRTFTVYNKPGTVEIAISEREGVEIGNAGTGKERVEDYLYEIQYNDIDYEEAKNYFREAPVAGLGACSAVRNGSWYGRNLDWFYSEQVDFVVRIPATGNRHATLAVCGLMPELTKDFVSEGKTSQQYKYLPFHVMDGINDCGVFCNVNVVPLDKGDFTTTVPYLEQRDSIPSRMLCRYILDNYSSAEAAVKDLAKYIAIEEEEGLRKSGQTSHFMIGDPEKTYIIEFIPDANGVMRVNCHETDTRKTPYDNSIMTNFFVNDVTFNPDGKVYTPETQDAEHGACRTNGITQFGSGLERYNLIIDNYASCDSKEGMIDLMHQLDYRRSYSTAEDIYGRGAAVPRWNTEFVNAPIAKGSSLVTTVESSPADFDYVEEYEGNEYLNRDRSLVPPTTWHTAHTTVYDLNSKKMYIFASSENTQEYSFDFKKYYTAAEIDERFGGLTDLPQTGDYVLTCMNGKLKWVEVEIQPDVSFRKH